MINFRYHIVSLIAVFLALAIGVIMGSAVIDRAIVNRLEDQQVSLESRIDAVEKENDGLRAENKSLTETADALAEQGSQRLLAGTLTDVPVLVVATRGVENDGFDALLSLLGTSGADRRGTIWLTKRFALDDDDEVRDLAAALGASPSMQPDSLRTLALTRLSSMLRDAAGPAVIDDPSVPTSTTTPVIDGNEGQPGTSTVFAALRDAGFLDFEAPEGSSGDAGPDLSPGTRLVVVSGRGSDVAVGTVAVAFTELLVADRPSVPAVRVLAAEDRVDDAADAKDEFVVPLRDDDAVSGRLSTVDNLGDFAGRLASVLAIVDLGDGRVGNYGRGPGAQRLLPAPPEGG